MARISVERKRVFWPKERKGGKGEKDAIRVVEGVGWIGWWMRHTGFWFDWIGIGPRDWSGLVDGRCS